MGLGFWMFVTRHSLQLLAITSLATRRRHSLVWLAYCCFRLDMKKQSVKLNRFTGEPRKWGCNNNSAIDLLLEKAEMWHYFSRLAKETGAAFAMEVMPPEVLRDLVESDRAKLNLLERFLHAREPLTEAERRYCEAEAIPFEKFIRRLPRP